MNKLILPITLMLPLTLLSSTVFANAIDSKAAYGDALVFVAIKFLIAAIVFYNLSFGLVKKPKDTAMKSARWFASILVTFSIIAFPNKYEIERNLFEMAFAAVVWFAIGFVIGYIWFKFKPTKDANVDNINVKTYVNKKHFYQY